jgi:hypothetical protein
VRVATGQPSGSSAAGAEMAAPKRSRKPIVQAKQVLREFMGRLKKNSSRRASAKWIHSRGKFNTGSRTVNASLDALDAAICPQSPARRENAN